MKSSTLPGRLGLGALLALSLLAGCHSRGDSAGGKTRLRFSGYAGSPAEGALMKKLVGDFNAAHPDIEVVYEPVPGQYYPKMLTMLVSKTAPDVFYLDVAYFEPFLSKDVVRPLDDFVASSTTTRPADFIPSLVGAFTSQGQLYGIPKDFNTLALFYNKPMFKAAGVAYPTADWTLADMRQAALKLTRPGGPAGFGLTHDSIDRYLPIARMYGAELFDATGASAIKSASAVAAMDFYAGLKREDHAAVYPSEVGSSWPGDVFGRGSAAMVFEGGWLIPYLRDTFPKLDYGITELPKGPVGRSNFLFTVAYVIPRTSQHAEAGWKLIEFLTSPASQAQIDFAVPSRTAIAKTFVQEHPVYAPILAGASYARPYAFGPKGDRVKDRLSVAVQEVVLGAKGSAEALLEASDDIDRINRL